MNQESETSETPDLGVGKDPEYLPLPIWVTRETGKTPSVLRSWSIAIKALVSQKLKRYFSW